VEFGVYTVSVNRAAALCRDAVGVDCPHCPMKRCLRSCARVIAHALGKQQRFCIRERAAGAFQ
jgi:hypothetical protein